MCLKKRKTIIRIFIQLKFHTFTMLILSSSSVGRSTLEVNHTNSGTLSKTPSYVSYVAMSDKLWCLDHVLTQWKQYIAEQRGN